MIRILMKKGWNPFRRFKKWKFRKSFLRERMRLKNYDFILWSFTDWSGLSWWFTFKFHAFLVVSHGFCLFDRSWHFIWIGNSFSFLLRHLFFLFCGVHFRHVTSQRLSFFEVFEADLASMPTLFVPAVKLKNIKVITFLDFLFNLEEFFFPLVEHPFKIIMISVTNAVIENHCDSLFFKMVRKLGWSEDNLGYNFDVLSSLCNSVLSSVDVDVFLEMLLHFIWV